ncbi:unnamed protein product [Cyclocybe aegerita]|uniref:Uncharacterized protein n=1 Tax=Cyclocybe aegerita TaxID=1973307 RepID=A0A8S0W462_CYCAE|nr:unnamed protein product [Cyclocybe aegerita]
MRDAILSRDRGSAPTASTQGLTQSRRDSTVQLSKRSGKPPPNHFGPGIQHKNKHKVISTTGFHPVPGNTVFKMATGVYSGHDINKAGASLVQHIKNALPWSSKNSKLGGTGYPKPQTGFKKNASDNPSPEHPDKVAYHFPTHPSSLFGKLHHPKSPGPDRLIGHRNTKDGKLHLAVAYHDKSKPIPSALSGHKPARDHPMSMAHPAPGGSWAVKGAKIIQGMKKILRFGRH